MLLRQKLRCKYLYHATFHPNVCNFILHEISAKKRKKIVVNFEIQNWKLKWNYNIALFFPFHSILRGADLLDQTRFVHFSFLFDTKARSTQILSTKLQKEGSPSTKMHMNWSSLAQVELARIFYVHFPVQRKRTKKLK